MFPPRFLSLLRERTPGTCAKKWAQCLQNDIAQRSEQPLQANLFSSSLSCNVRVQYACPQRSSYLSDVIYKRTAAFVLPLLSQSGTNCRICTKCYVIYFFFFIFACCRITGLFFYECYRRSTWRSQIINLFREL